MSVFGREEFLKVASEKFGVGGQFTNREMLEFVADQNIARADYNWIFTNEHKVARGLYKLPAIGVSQMPKQQIEVPASAPQMIAQVIPMNKFNPNTQSEYDHVNIPAVDKHFVPFGDFDIISKVIKSNEFFPIFISGLSGNGKTFTPEQICARNKRAMVRVQMSRETDEDDLIGGFRLINGETKFMKGPVLRAMETGSILLIDEADRSDPGKVMCIQGILEGKPYYVKKTGEVVQPRPGFNVIVTANTKGKGSDDGRYVAAGILDDAWLERFPITIEQKYPNASIETKILKGYLCENGVCSEENTKFVAHLIDWANIVRKTFEENAIDEVISTRRLVHIIRTFKIFNDRMEAINLCINRFDTETKNAFLDLYAKVDPTVAPVTPAANTAPSTPQDVVS